MPKEAKLGKLQYLFGLFMITSADMGSGIFLTHFLGKAFAQSLYWWSYSLGIFLALVPDVDVILQKLTRGKIDSKHREITHYPMFVVPAAFLFVGLLGSLLGSSPLFWGTLAGSCLVAHFLHDSIGEANRWGIKWLAPYYWNSYQLLMRKYPGENLRIICIWTSGELARVKLFSLETWIRTYYLRATGESIASLVWLAAAILIAFL